MKKLISMILCCALLLILAGCAGTTVVVGNCTCPPEAHQTVAAPTDASDEVLGTGALKTGLAILPSLGKSAAATAEADGKADFDVTVVAVTVDERGLIQNCIIDSVGYTAAFTAAGEPVAAGTVEVLSKNEKGFDYGMAKVAPSGKEWFEQADALARFAVGKTAEQVVSGYGADVDLATSATIYLGGYVSGIEAAVANAENLGAVTGDELKLAITAEVNSAAAEVGGSAELTLNAAVVTLDGEIITSCVIDSLQASVAFDAAGTITTDLTAVPKTKTQLGFDYGMVAYKKTPIGKEWFEQVDYFCEFVTDKTLTQVAGIAVNEEDMKTTDVDLATGCTISIGDFLELIAKAAG